MTMLKKEDVRKYQELYRKRFGEKISFEKAREEGEKLVGILKLTYRPIKKSEVKKLQRELKNYEQKQDKQMG